MGYDTLKCLIYLGLENKKMEIIYLFAHTLAPISNIRKKTNIDIDILFIILKLHWKDS